MMGLYEHLEGELDTAGFFYPPEKRPSMIRNLRVAMGRARFTDQEVRTFRGVISALTRGRGRTLAKLARLARSVDKTVPLPDDLAPDAES
jgi:tRNA/rRNA methyltransferase